jgi:hypothetical protein
MPIVSTRKLPLKSCHLIAFHRLRKTANINGKKTSRFKASCKDSKKLQDSWTCEAAKIISTTRHMYGHNMLMSLLTRAKLFETQFLHSHVSDIKLWWMTVYPVEKRTQHCQATSFISDLDDVNFPLTVVNCDSPFGCYLISIGVI